MCDLRGEGESDRHDDSENGDVAAGMSEILESFLLRLEAGEIVSVDEALAQHPEYAGQLAVAFEQLATLHHVAQGLDSGLTPWTPLPLNANAGLGIIGDFRIVGEIGRGGMGVVYEAEQISLRRTVALKVLPFAGLLDERNLNRFRNEAQAAAQLHHPNIVPVYANGAERGMHYYAMHLIRGCTLADVADEQRQRTSGPIPDAGRMKPDQGGPADRSASIPRTSDTIRATLDDTAHAPEDQNYYLRIADLVRQAALALDYAHEQGILHRDVKPANLMLGADGRLWITDFGLARFRHDVTTTTTGELVGTLRYMSPEQASGSRLLDERSDVYGLGATLYELATLEPTFPYQDSQQLMYAVLNQEPASPRSIAAGVPRDLETIILKSMAKDRSDRYSSAKALADDLQRFVDGRPIQGRRTSVWQRTLRWSMRNSAVTALSLATTLALAVIAIGAAWYQSQLQISKARAATFETARNTERYLTFLTQARRLAAGQPSGWTKQALECLDEAAKLPPAQLDSLELRTEIASVLCAPDVIQVGTLHHRDTVYCLAYRADGKQLAVGHNLNEGLVPVEIWDPLQGLLLETREFPADPDYVTAHGVHGDGVRAIAFSPNSRYLAVLSRSGWIHVWDQSLAPARRWSWKAHSAGQGHLAFGSNDELLSAGQNGHLQLWNLKHHELVRSMRFESELLDVSLRLMGRAVEIYCTTNDGLQVLNYRTFRSVEFPIDQKQVRRVECSPTHYFSVADLADGRLQIIDDKARTVRVIPMEGDYAAHTGIGNCLAVKPDGGMFASTCSEQEVKIWDPMSGKLLWRRAYRNGANTFVQFSPHSEHLAITANDETHIYRINNQPYVFRQAQSAYPISNFDSHNRYHTICTLARSGVADETFRLRRWKFATYGGHVIRSDYVKNVDGDVLSCLSSNRFALGQNGSRSPDRLDFHEKGAITASFPVEYVCALGVDPTGQCVFAACSWRDDTTQARTSGVRGWEFETNKEVFHWVNQPSLDRGNVPEIGCLAVGSQIVAVGGFDGSINILARDPTALRHHLIPNADRVRCIALSPDERWAYAGTSRGKLVVVDTSNGAIANVVDAHAESIESLALNVEGDVLATGCGDGTIRIWKPDGSTAKPLFSLPRQRDRIVRIEFSPRRSLLLSLTRGDSAIQVWNIDYLGDEFQRRGLGW